MFFFVIQALINSSNNLYTKSVYSAKYVHHILLPVAIIMPEAQFKDSITPCTFSIPSTFLNLRPCGK